MAPLKFEEDMQRKFEERTIQPSKNSWEKVEFLLEKSDRKKKPFSWMQIAVGFIIAISAVSIYYAIDNSATIDTTIVEHNEYTLPEEYKKRHIENNINQPGIVIKRSSDSTIGLDTKTRVVTTRESTKPRKIDTAQKSTTIKQQSTIEESITRNSTNKLVDTDSVEIQEKVRQIANYVASLEKNETALTDKEVEILLIEAQREILNSKIKSSKNVDALALLSDVESELDETFKEKVLEALKAGYKKVKTAVAQRNN